MIEGGDFFEGSLIICCFQKCFAIWERGRGVSSVWNLGIYGLEIWKLECSEVRGGKLEIRMFSI